MERPKTKKASHPHMVLEAGKRFDRYKDEDGGRVRDADVRQNATLMQLRDIWTKHDLDELNSYYRTISDFLRNLPYSPDDIDRFITSLAEFQDERKFQDKAGAFLSALVKNGAGSGYVIDMSHLPPLNGLGFRIREKSLTINGNAGSFVGMQMENGKITVDGDVSDQPGAFMEGGKIEIRGNAGKGIGFCMRGGEILVEKDADLSAGSSMTGGTIVIMGNAGSLIGANMNGGVIRVEGGIDSLGKVNHGKVYHKGKLMVDK